MLRIHRGSAGQFVAAFVFRMPCVAFHPFPLDFMLAECRIKTLPEIDILHRFFVGCFPAPFFPVMDPLGDPLAHILAVRAQHNIAVLFQRLKGNNRGHQLHTVVGGQAVAFVEGFFVFAITQNRTVAPRAWVAEA